MLNEGEKCRKSTYCSIMNNALPTWASIIMLFASLLFNLRKTSDEVAKEVAGCLMGAYLT